MKYRALFGLIPGIFLAACFTTLAATPDNEERGRLSTKMVNLSEAVDTYFAGIAKAPTESDTAILQNATRHDKRLLAAEFERYVLKVQYQNPYAVLLLCSKDEKIAIMEDAGCSARIDRQVTDAAPCKFTLHVNQGCHVDGADSP